MTAIALTRLPRLRRWSGLIVVLTIGLAALLTGVASATTAKRSAARVPQGFFGTVLGDPLYPGLISDSSSSVFQNQMNLMVSSGVESVRLTFDWAAAQPYRSWSKVPADQQGNFSDDGVDNVPTNFTVLDSMGPGRGHRTRDLLKGPGSRHIFLAYIGMGFAMDHLPRPLWKKVIPDLSPDPYYPTMSWLAVDGYGFDLAYFHTKRWVDEQKVPAPYRWEGSPDYFLRAVDQGIGRALWFICGAQAPDVAAAAGRFAGHRQPDLWSGIGLAAAFAGGCDEAGLAALRRAAGDDWPQLALGVVFAAKARAYSGLVPDHTQAACSALAGISVDKAVSLADGTAPTAADAGTEPAYELWRQRIRAHFEA